MSDYLHLVHSTASPVSDNLIEISGNDMSGAYSSGGGNSGGEIERRVSRLEDGLQGIKDSITSVQTDLSGMRASALTQTNMDLFRTEIRADQASLRTDISNLTVTLRTELSGLTTTIRTEQSNLSTKVTELGNSISEAKGKIDSLPSTKWLTGALSLASVVVSGIVTLAVFLIKHLR